MGEELVSGIEEEGSGGHYICMYSSDSLAKVEWDDHFPSLPACETRGLLAPLAACNWRNSWYLPTSPHVSISCVQASGTGGGRGEWRGDDLPANMYRGTVGRGPVCVPKAGIGYAGALPQRGMGRDSEAPWRAYRLVPDGVAVGFWGGVTEG